MKEGDWRRLQEWTSARRCLASIRDSASTQMERLIKLEDLLDGCTFRFVPESPFGLRVQIKLSNKIHEDMLSGNKYRIQDKNQKVIPVLLPHSLERMPGELL